MSNLKDKTAIITGGGQGLGKAVAIALAQEGVHIGLIGRNEEKLKATLAELQALNVKAYYSVCSVDDEQAVIKSVAELAEVLGGIDILINNAGIGNFGSIESMPSDEWQQVIKTNLFGPYFTAKAVYPYLQAKGAGDIVNVSSTAGLKAGGNMSAYAASKAALISLSQSMMAEWRKQNIRVITLTPSTIASEMSINGGLTNGNPETVLQPEDFAEWVRDILKMNRRALIANGSIFSNNP
ncbi:3-ketoacyl-ACP reductase [Mucilaginibacter sp. JRF]|uniref:3-ketoacyl-ACP reductase n=1 Tax=Mucilaginibacter sp. JRF TaxID=2780088 RepID=UPI0018814791|nr:3-ketoacyl-ACP reductase [Mucilaginibacter sp. JRF]MBE9583141.1 3-ketoacyl-ACP reductase [Mucilaginibacter sp. JRF]